MSDATTVGTVGKGSVVLRDVELVNLLFTSLGLYGNELTLDGSRSDSVGLGSEVSGFCGSGDLPSVDVTIAFGKSVDWEVDLSRRSEIQKE